MFGVCGAEKQTLRQKWKPLNNGLPSGPKGSQNEISSRGAIAHRRKHNGQPANPDREVWKQRYDVEGKGRKKEKRKRHGDGSHHKQGEIASNEQRDKS